MTFGHKVVRELESIREDHSWNFVDLAVAMDMSLNSPQDEHFVMGTIKELLNDGQIEELLVAPGYARLFRFKTSVN